MATNGKTKRALDILDHPPVTSEAEQLAQQDGSVIASFLRNLVPFFATATALEKDANTTLQQARALAMPTDAESDEAVQVFVKGATAKIKMAEDHWGIAQRINSLHKRITAGRAKTTGPLEQARTIGNQLHATYAAAERQRAAEEQDRIRRQREEEARVARERELAVLEAQAAEREAASPDLSEREQAFVAAYTGASSRRGNGEASAQAAGFKNPGQTAVRLLGLPKIQAAIAAAEEAIAIRLQAQAKREQPLAVEVERVKPQVGGAGFDRTSHTAELVDEAAFVEAFRQGKHGIPSDALTAKQTKLNEYARSLHERVELWPGVRYVKKTSIV